MSTLPERPDLDHLRKQAKDLLRSYGRRESSAFERLRTFLPTARNKSDSVIASLNLKLHDMQSCVAREHGFASWTDLKAHVEWSQLDNAHSQARRLYWLRLVYGGAIAGGSGRMQPVEAARLLAEEPALAKGDAYFACAIGDEAAVSEALARDPRWVNRSGGLLNVPPLLAVCHSGLASLDQFRERLRQCTRLLLDAGADPNASTGSRQSPHSIDQPGEDRLSALYGAAGRNHDPVMTDMLLQAGADPNDAESLYHSLEDTDRSWPCTRLLLKAGADVLRANALNRSLDFDNPSGLRLILEYTPKLAKQLDHALLWAIFRGRSAEHVRALLEAGAIPFAINKDGDSAYRLAVSAGLTEVMRVLEEAGAAEPISVEDRFVNACASVDEQTARRLLSEHPGLFTSMSEHQLRQLPKAAMLGSDDAVRLMVALGWPIAARGGDIDCSALNWAVFRANVELTRFLLEHGASWREPHRYGGDVVSLLSWASLYRAGPNRDWAGCAEALLAHGLPKAHLLPKQSESDVYRRVLIDGREIEFPDEVIDVLVE